MYVLQLTKSEAIPHKQKNKRLDLFTDCVSVAPQKGLISFKNLKKRENFCDGQWFFWKDIEAPEVSIVQ